MSYAIGKSLFKKTKPFGLRVYKRSDITWFFYDTGKVLVYLGYIMVRRDGRISDGFSKVAFAPKDVIYYCYSLSYIENYSGDWITSDFMCEGLQETLDLVLSCDTDQLTTRGEDDY